MNSSRKINYSTRIAKNIERKMLRDILIRFSSNFPMSDYTYVGFGSKFFTDFLMFHKYLHINKLISIEGDEGNRKKYDFNKPLNCIEMMYGMSSDILPNLQLNKNKSIIWLDFDGLLEESCLADIASLAERLETGSVLFISYNSRPLKSLELRNKYPNITSEKEQLERYLRDVHGENYLPHKLELRGLKKWDDYSRLLREIIINCLTKRLEIKNRGASEKIQFKQIVNFNYQDGCEMSTLGFTFFNNEEDLAKIEDTRLDAFDFYCDDKEYYQIEVPSLTMKEIKALLEIMPKASKGAMRKMESIIPPSEIIQFSKIYKYLPLFTDSEIS